MNVSEYESRFKVKTITYAQIGSQVSQMGVNLVLFSLCKPISEVRHLCSAKQKEFAGTIAKTEMLDTLED